jgi:parvulin-like peptidyl-prolyl isomerase
MYFHERPFGRLASLWPLLLYGCAGGQDSAPTGGPTRPDIVAEESAERDPSPAVAIVDGRPVRQADLAPALLEIGGSQALTEAILDLRIEAEARRRGVEVTADDLSREESLLQASLDADADATTRLLATLRSDRGLGPVRYAALIRRNALLRAMVAPEVSVTESDIAAHFDLQYGERRQARIITTPSLAGAVEAIRRLGDGASFADLAVELSTDSSAARGGLLAPVSRSDATYPQPLRTTLWTLEPGGISPPIMLDGSYAILECERIISANETPLETVRGEIEELARLHQERILMETLARELLAGASITILDAELDRQWRDPIGN